MRDKRLYWGERVEAIIRFLLTRTNSCATFNEILEGIAKVNARSAAKDIVAQTKISLTRLAKKKIITRSWVKLGARKKRLYCLNKSF